MERAAVTVDGGALLKRFRTNLPVQETSKTICFQGPRKKTVPSRTEDVLVADLNISCTGGLVRCSGRYRL